MLCLIIPFKKWSGLTQFFKSYFRLFENLSSEKSYLSLIFIAMAEILITSVSAYFANKKNSEYVKMVENQTNRPYLAYGYYK